MAKRRRSRTGSRRTSSRSRGNAREEAVVAFFQSPAFVLGAAGLALWYVWAKKEGKLPAWLPQLPVQIPGMSTTPNAAATR